MSVPVYRIRHRSACTRDPRIRNTIHENPTNEALHSTDIFSPVENRRVTKIFAEPKFYIDGGSNVDIHSSVMND